MVSCNMADWLGSWKYRYRATVDQSNVSENLTHFPVTLFLNGSAGLSSADVTPIFDELGDSNLKLAVTQDDGTSQLFVEIDDWNSSSETAVLHISNESWVVNASSDTEVYLYFDAAQADNTDFVGVPGSVPGMAVWNDAYVGVWHMSDNPDTSHIKDSTHYHNDGTKKAENEPIEAAGAVGKAQVFDGTDDYVNCGIDASLNIVGSITLEAMVNGTSSLANGAGIVSKSGTSTYVHLLAISSTAEFRIWDGTNNPTARDTVISLNDNNWHVLAGVRYYQESISIYVDGSLKKSTNDTAGVIITDVSNYIAKSNWAVWNGTIDEVRISSVARSAPWIGTTNYTLRDELLTWGALERGVNIVAIMNYYRRLRNR